MAKSRQALAKWRGRAGAMVYSVRDGQQIISAAPEKMTNPRTAAQAAQRMKLAPAGAFYRTLEGLVNLGLISHTFQGRKYGEENRRRFMQLAMLNNQGPFVPKDTLSLVPGDFQISEGSLPSFTGRIVCDDDTAGASTDGLSELGRGFEITAENVQEFASALGCEVGDQISVLYFQFLGGAYVPSVERMIVEAGHTLGDDVLPNYGVNMDYFFYVQDETMAAGSNTWGSAVLYADGQAAAIIISQKQANGNYLRSTEFIHINDEIRQKYYSPEAYDAALASYMDATNENNNASPYYNNLGNDQPFNGKIFCSPMKAVDSTTGESSTYYVFWGQTTNGNNVIFTQTGASDGRLCYLYRGEPVLGRYAGQVGVPDVYLDDLTTSKNWAGVWEWKDEYYDQWESGQRAVRPINTNVDEDETKLVPSTELAELLGESWDAADEIKVSKLTFEGVDYGDVVVVVKNNTTKPMIVTHDTTENVVNGAVEGNEVVITSLSGIALTTNPESGSIILDGVTFGPTTWGKIYSL